MAEIKISDLSIGDWVEWKVYEKPYVMHITQITDTIIRGVHDGIEYGMLLKQINPIPLTPEILEKNGFVRGEYSEIREYNEWEIGEWDNLPYVSVKLDIDRQVIRVTNRGRDMFIADKEVYVHQLQHALRLAGVEKEIEV